MGVLLYSVLGRRIMVPTKEEWYPSYHLSPKTGWMNDPNGLIYYDNHYHAFYQYNPHDPQPGGLIHWGHAISKNLVDWIHLPIAISPSMDDDSNGCFSGSAVNDSGILSLIYTGNSNISNNPRQVQMLATSKDGVEFTKHGTVLNAPPGVPDFRDPKVWREGNEWFLILGTKSDGSGEVHTYKSPDLRKWKLDTVLAKGNGLGFMWECPDFFKLNEKWVLVISPQGVPPEGYLYRNLHQSGYFVGNWKPGQSYAIEKEFRLLDYGHDYYAPQSFEAPDGRRILIAWLDMWESIFPESHQNWSGMLSLPREIELKDGQLRIKPVREVSELRSQLLELGEMRLNNQYVTLEHPVKTLELILNWDVSGSKAEKYGIRLGYEGTADGGVYIYVDNQAGRLVLDRKYGQYGISGYRSIELPKGDVLSLRIFFDHSSVEVFVNDGEAVISSRIYPEHDQRHLKVFAENGNAVLRSSQRWLLKSKTGNNVISQYL